MIGTVGVTHCIPDADGMSLGSAQVFLEHTLY